MLRNTYDDYVEKMEKAGGTKYDGEKTMFQLLVWTFIEEMARVMTFGAKKYGEYNWQQGINTSKLYGAAYRHILQVIKGEVLDKESGLNHLAHAACNLMFLFWMMRERPDLDDQPCDLPG